jgi:hypothetical protein
MRLRGRVAIAVVGACLAGLVGAEAADAALINPVSQTRTISASAQNCDSVDCFTDSQSDSATDFGPFDSTATAQVDVSGVVSASAQQQSSIGPSVVLVYGSADSPGFIPSSNPRDSSASSHFELTFDVLQPLTYTLYAFGYVRESDPGPSGSSHFRLAGGPGNETIVDVGTISDSGFGPFPEQGALLPGRYTLLAESQVWTPSPSISASYSVEFTVVPEPSTGLLLAGGLLALAARRQRRTV